jgi:hypothetical protein
LSPASSDLLSGGRNAAAATKIRWSWDPRSSLHPNLRRTATTYDLPPTAVSSDPVQSRSCRRRKHSTISPVKSSAGVRFPPRKSRSSRHLVQAGDLHSSTAFGEAYRPLGRSLSIPHLPRRELYETPEFLHFDGVDFDLRQEVMNCIAVSIGLSQPPLSDNTSGEASPSFSAAESTAGGPSSRQVVVSWAHRSVPCHCSTWEMILPVQLVDLPPSQRRIYEWTR